VLHHVQHVVWSQGALESRPQAFSVKRTDIVGQPPSSEIGVPNMPSLKAKKLSKFPQEKVLLEL
jgi:hypothetical protein